jgi:pentatricopeptide repeat-containing protein PET309
MLERTVGCREPGSLRRLLPGSQKSLRSCRTLHSGFWHHSALDLEVSPLCSALIGRLTRQDRYCEPRHQTNSMMQAGFLLDFLYPSGTISFLRQYSGWGLRDRQDSGQIRLGSGRGGQKLFTSFAEDSSEGSSAVEITSAPAVLNSVPYSSSGIWTASDKTGQSSIKGHLPIASPQNIRDNKAVRYEEAWERYLLLEGSRKNESRLELVRYMSQSGRVVDAERTVELFQQLDSTDMDIDAYSAAIRSHLKLQNLSEARTLYNDALIGLKFPAGADQILSYMLDNSLWSDAVEFWTNFQSFRDRFPRLSYNIYSIVDRHHRLIYLATELGEYVNMTVETSLESSKITAFASKIAQRALMKPESAEEESRFEALLLHLRKWDCDTTIVFTQVFTKLLELNKTRFAVRCYRKAREDSRVKFSRPTLNSMLTVFCKNHSVLGMQQVLDDFFRFYSHPTRSAYRKCMTEFASQGDIKTVHALFEQFLARFARGGKRLTRASDIAPVLHVHARRGELGEVRKYFNQLQTVHGLEPDLLCWNVLIDAYAKVHNTDGAFEVFETILKSDDVQPDSYTFGTIMGVCATRGDFDRVVETYRLALSMKIEKSAAMVDCLVLSYIQNDQLQEAEKLCENALNMELKGSKTRMWNYLLLAHAMRRDIVNVNRLLRRMSEARLDYDQYTYSAMMQALAMVRQPDRAYTILKHVMKDAGIKRTSFHYAVVMGGYIAVKDFRSVFRIQNRMMRRSVPHSADTRLLAMKAADQRLLQTGTDAQQSRRALEMFKEVLSSLDIRELSFDSQKGMRSVPRDIAYPAMFYSYVIFVLGQSNEFGTAEELYQEFLQTIPESIRSSPPIDVLSAMMIMRMRNRDWKGVQEFWDLSVSKAKTQGMPLRSFNVSLPPDISILDPLNLSPIYKEAPKVTSVHQLDLTRCLTAYMNALSRQDRTSEIPSIVNGLLEDGFLLDNKNWNHYIQLLARHHDYKGAFELCEEKLMDNWTGWARDRWLAPVRNRLPIELRAKKKNPLYLRPNTHTFLHLARGFIELQAMSAESKASRTLLDDLQLHCPRTIRAVKTLQMTEGDLEQKILGDLRDA